MTNEVPLRLKVVIRGAVQGVGFRPFVFRLASELRLSGWVSNTLQGVFIEAEGKKSLLDEFLLRIGREKPPRAFIQSFESSFLDTVGYSSFEIRHSEAAGTKSVLVLPDIAVCPECLAEVLNPSNRRYRYPFTNCTNCGPRFSIIEKLPYDRANTSMRRFPMCSACRGEYEDPGDRRFHAQPNACPVCGPRIALWDRAGLVLAERDDALVRAGEAIHRGLIVAVKGLGGFHLMCDAANAGALRELRRRKHREEKPFALMVPSMETARELCDVSDAEERLLGSPESPIVILPSHRKSQSVSLACRSEIAPNNPFLGLMLPYTPLHHLLLREIGWAVVATSGNLADEPICTDEMEALRRLGGIADLFLVHDRPIVRHVDDSIVRVALGREMVLRRARGYAPLPMLLPAEPEKSLLAVGAHLKNAVAITAERNAFVSQHIGDLETEESLSAFRGVIGDLGKMFGVELSRIAADLHPDYLSTQYALTSGLPVVRVQHHYAHIASCMAENDLTGPLLGVSWDGTGFGPDGTIWGGEFLRTVPGGFDRVATFRTFRLPGGEAAVKEPRRAAAGILFELDGVAALENENHHPVLAFTPAERRTILRMLERRTNAPLTTSAGRLFDAVASLVGLRQVMRHEGQAAMELEWTGLQSEVDEAYTFTIDQEAKSGPIVIDWEPMVMELLRDVGRGLPVSVMSRKFHIGLAAMIVKVAALAGGERVVLSGGCFQNVLLLTETVGRLKDAGFRPYWHQRIPPNDGGIALGQIFAVVRSERQDL